MVSLLSIIATMFLLTSPVISNPLYVIARNDTIIDNDEIINFDVEPEVDIGSPEIDESDVNLLLSNDETLNVQRQAILNKIVDRTIAAIVKNLTEQNMGKIPIPDLDYSFSTGPSWWSVTGDLHASGGTFEDLTTLKRTEEAIMKKKGKKLTVSCGVGVTRAQAAYQHYNLRYGIVKVNGQITIGSIDDISISASASLDYEEEQCKTVLEMLRVSHLGQVSIHMTGLGPLNGMLSSLATWIVGKWQQDIVATLELKLKEIANENLHNFDCEKYRPGGKF